MLVAGSPSHLFLRTKALLPLARQTTNRYPIAVAAFVVPILSCESQNVPTCSSILDHHKSPVRDNNYLCVPPITRWQYRQYNLTV
jgi:hypothetical protein